MGARTQVLIKDTGVYLYSHWGSGSIMLAVVRAIANEWRWDDPEYLARIIFDEMMSGNHGGETGFGIGTKMHGDLDNLVTVDCDKQEVTYTSMSNGQSSTSSFQDLVADAQIKAESLKELK